MTLRKRIDRLARTHAQRHTTPRQIILYGYSPDTGERRSAFPLGGAFVLRDPGESEACFMARVENDKPAILLPDNGRQSL
jgi:hypothetical protein